MAAVAAAKGITATGALRARAELIPLRLTEHERAVLNVLEGALSVSEYTDKVDVISFRYNRPSRVQQQLEEVLAAISGLTVAASYREGSSLVSQNSLVDNAEFFRRVFEIGRRYKMMNPDKMRATYGKLMYILQDAVMSDTRSALGFNCLRRINTVQAELEDLEAAAMLDDEECAAAVMPVQHGESQLRKHEAMTVLIRRYAGEDANKGLRIERCLLSIGDEEVLTQAHVAPVDTMLELLREHFSLVYDDKAHSLAIAAGRNGARLSHSHSTQFMYVEQSLLLWRAILVQLPYLWVLAEKDLLHGHDYRLRDTGQGLNRVQSAPAVARFMHGVISNLQGKVGGWVGSSAVHLGDNDVPNALHWIDKYTQIPRILIPIVEVVDSLESMAQSGPGFADYLQDAFGSIDNCRKVILGDFFRYGFDGSGADNYFDAGSCIDGRLTSAWNWCSKLSKKSYYNVFKMAGFIGFDGSFAR